MLSIDQSEYNLRKRGGFSRILRCGPRHTPVFLRPPALKDEKYASPVKRMPVSRRAAPGRGNADVWRTRVTMRMRRASLKNT